MATFQALDSKGLFSVSDHKGLTRGPYKK